MPIVKDKVVDVVIVELSGAVNQTITRLIEVLL